MGRKVKYSKEFKISIVQRYLSGENSSLSLGKELGIHDSIIRTWAKQYSQYGETAFEPKQINSSYTKEFKEMVVLEYLNGGGSYDTVTMKYRIPSSSTVKQWVKRYNSHIE